MIYLDVWDDMSTLMAHTNTDDAGGWRMSENTQAFCLITQAAMLYWMTRYGAVVQPAGTAAALHLVIEGTHMTVCPRFYKKTHSVIWKMFLYISREELHFQTLKFHLQSVSFRKIHKQLFHIQLTDIID